MKFKEINSMYDFYSTTVIAFAGNIASGKDTAAKYLEEEYGYTHYKFANKLQDIVAVFLGEYKESLSHRQLYEDRAWKETSIKGYPYSTSPRYLMQLIGKNLRDTLSPEVWIDTLEKEMTNDMPEKMVISDLRYPNEYYWLKSFSNSTVVYLDDVDNQPNTKEAVSHESESHQSFLKSLADITIMNSKKEGKVSFYLSLIAALALDN